VRLRALGGRLGLAVLGVLVVLGVGEIVVRAAGLGPKRFYHPRYVENPWKSVAIDTYPTNPRGYFDLDLHDPAVNARLTESRLDLGLATQRTPYAVELHYNEHRCRDHEVVWWPGYTHIVVLGDSFTEGQGVREADTFTRRLERTLQAEGRKVQIYNCGRRGRDFPELFDAFIELVSSYRPDILVYAMVLNDAVQSPEFRAEQPFLNDWILDRRRMVGEEGPDGARGSRLWALAKDRYESRRVAEATTRWYIDMYGPRNQAGWDATRHYLETMKSELDRRDGGKLLVALLPLLVDRRHGYPFAGPARAIKKACDDAGISFVDLSDSVAGEPAESLWVHPVDMHPNEKAHAIFAAALHDAIVSAVEGR